MTCMRTNCGMRRSTCSIRRPHADGLCLVPPADAGVRIGVALCRHAGQLRHRSSLALQADASDPPSLATISGRCSAGMSARSWICTASGFSDHPEPNRLVLPREHCRRPWRRPARRSSAPKRRCNGSGIRTLPEVLAPDVQALPFGPVRADVLESAEFTFLYIGEQILHYHPHLFFKHRGMEARFQGLDAERGVILAERVSGVGTIAHALAYCQAVEDACRLHGSSARALAARAAGGIGAACTIICTTWDTSPIPRR